MTARPSLVRSIPFWILLVGSLASTIVGAWLVVTKIQLMNSTLTDGSATGVEVYGGQAWVTLGAALVGAGLVGFVAALVLAVLRSFVPAARVQVGDPIAAESYGDEPVFAETDATAGYIPAAPVSDAPVVVTDEPAVSAPASSSTSASAAASDENTAAR
jgi:hypothetical protein